MQTFKFFFNKTKQLIFKTYVFPQQFQVQVQAHFLKKERFGFNPKSIYPVNYSEITYEIKVHTVPSLEFTGANSNIISKNYSCYTYSSLFFKITSTRRPMANKGPVIHLEKATKIDEISILNF